jgi:hypothetical protein
MSGGRIARAAPDKSPPALEPASNNRVDPSPYYPVFGRRMVMISYARRTSYLSPRPFPAVRRPLTAQATHPAQLS